MELAQIVPVVSRTLVRAKPYGNVAKLARGAWEHWVLIVSAMFVNLIASNGLEVTCKSFNWPWLTGLVDGMGMSWKAAVVQGFLHAAWVGAVKIAARKNQL